MYVWLQVCQATLQLINVLLQCPLAAVFLREMVFGPHCLAPNTPEVSSPQDHTSPLHPLTPPSCTSTPRVSLLTAGDNGIAGQRKKLEDSVSRFVHEDSICFLVYLWVFLFHFPTLFLLLSLHSYSVLLFFAYPTSNFPPSSRLPLLLPAHPHTQLPVSSAYRVTISWGCNWGNRHRRLSYWSTPTGELFTWY